MTLIAGGAGRSLAVLLAAGAALLALAGVADARPGEVPTRAKLAAPGQVVSAAPLKRRLWPPRATRSAFELKYVTKDAFDRRAVSTGTVFLPKGRMPRRGWPVISWAHGSVGLGDGCAPSRVGSAFPELERPYLAKWIRQGYAIVATDYVGLGTPGLHAPLHGRSEAHSVVDMVKAARDYVGEHLRRQRLARKWAVVGQSQGGGAAMYTARYATQLGGRRLDYRGAVGTSMPAYTERLVSAVGPNLPPLPPTVTANGAYILAGLRYVHPELGIDGTLTPEGRRLLELAETECVIGFSNMLEGFNAADAFSRPVASLPGWEETINRYMALPESGFDRPFFIGHGSRDASAPYASTAEYVSVLQQNGAPVTFKTYDNDHLGTWIESQRDTIPFVRGLFAGKRG